MKRVFAIATVTAWVFVLVLLRSAIKDFLWTHPWWHSFIEVAGTTGTRVFSSLGARRVAGRSRVGGGPQFFPSLWESTAACGRTFVG